MERFNLNYVSIGAHGKVMQQYSCGFRVVPQKVIFKIKAQNVSMDLDLSINF